MSRLYSTAMGFVNYGPLEDPNMALNEAYQRWVENPSTNPTRLDYELAAQAAFAMEQERKQLLSAGSVYEPQAIQAGKDVEYWRNIALSSPFLGVKLGSSDVLDLGPKGKKIADFLARNRARKALRDARKTQDRPDLNPPTTNIPDDQPAPATTILRPEPTSEPTDSTTEPSEPKRNFLDRLRALRNKVIGEPDTDSSPTSEPTPVSEPEPTPEPERPRVSPALIREPRPQPGIRPERTRPAAGPPARPTREAYEQRVSGQVLNPNDYD